MLWKAEVIADNSGEWCSNGLRFASRAEADNYARDLAWRWIAVREWRVVECADPPPDRYLFDAGKRQESEPAARQWCENCQLTPEQEAEVLAGFLSKNKGAQSDD
jgi:hypothetical protein